MTGAIDAAAAVDAALRRRTRAAQPADVVVQRVHRAGTAMAVVVAAVGALVVGGWLVDLEALTEASSRAGSMKLATAGGLLMIGLATVLLIRRGPGRAPLVLGAGAAAFGALTLVEYAAGVSLGIDDPLGLVDDPAIVNPGRMSPGAAVTLTFLGGALAAFALGRPRVAQAACAASIVVATAASVGHLYGAEFLYRVAENAAMSPLTALTSLIAGVAVLASTPSVGWASLVLGDSLGGVTIRRLLPVGVLVPMALGGLIAWWTRNNPGEETFSLALFAVATMVASTVLIVVAAARLRSVDLRRASAEEALSLVDENRRLRARYEAMFELSAEAVMLFSPEGKRIEGNTAGDRILGFPVGATAWGDAFEVHPDDWSAVVAAFTEVLAGTRSPTEPWTLRVRAADGSWHWFEASGTDLTSVPDVGGVLIVARDVHDRVEADAELAQARADLAAMFSSTTVGMMRVDLDGSVLDVNDAMCRLVGSTHDDLVGSTAGSRVHPDDQDPSSRAAVFLGERDSYVGELRLRHDDGHWVWVRIEVGLARAGDGSPLFVVVQVIDIDEEKRLSQLAAEATEQLAWAAAHDPLTGLRNRASLTTELDAALARADRSGHDLAVLFVDLDRFKPVNDELGHAAGDEVLAGVAERIRATVRAGDLPSRFGGDEFVVVCPDLDDAAVAAGLADRLVDALRAPYATSAGVATIGASVGVAVRATGETAASLLRRADEALYAAKAAGRDRAVVHAGA